MEPSENRKHSSYLLSPLDFNSFLFGGKEVGLVQKVSTRPSLEQRAWEGVPKREQIYTD